MKKLLRKNNSLIIFLFVLLLPMQVFGASLFSETKDQIFYVGNDFLVEVLLDTEGESINAVSGKIIFDPNILELKEVRDGNSSINFWIEKPASKNLGEIVFSGITPGGLYSQKSFLFGIVFNPKMPGNNLFNFKDTVVLKNDGSGSQAKIKAQQFNLKISEESPQPTSGMPQIEDRNPPEDFKPMLGVDPEIFEGKYFLIFSTTDKGLGVDHYEVREGIFGEYVRAESPYLIENQSLNKDIYVKAVDRALNERVAVLEEGEWYQQYLLLGIIILALIAFVFVFKKLWTRFTK